MSYFDRYVDVNTLLGKTLIDVQVNETKHEITFVTDEGDTYVMYHEQDCCEHVSIDDINGNISDLIDWPLTLAEVSTNSNDNPKSKWEESWTWTFYRFATVKGYVDIKWYGASNGYYSEYVSFIKTNK